MNIYKGADMSLARPGRK